MPYVKTIWTNSSGESINETNLNKIETGVEAGVVHSEALHAPTNADNTATNETSHADVLVDADALTAVSPTNKIVTETDMNGLSND